MEDKKIIINIGRQIGSGGRVIAKRLAEQFNCKFYDKELLNLAAKESGFSEKFFEQNDEHKGFLHTLFHIHGSLFGQDSYYKNEFSEESLYQFQSDAIRKAAQEGSCVFVGRTADYVLRDMKDTVSIFVSANMDQRLQRVCKRHGLDRATGRKYIHKHEEERASYYNYYTGKTWGAAESYDLCVNSSVLGIDATCDFIADFVRRRFSLRHETYAEVKP